MVHHESLLVVTEKMSSTRAIGNRRKRAIESVNDARSQEKILGPFVPRWEQTNGGIHRNSGFISTP
jgi:hypothetical protein